MPLNKFFGKSKQDLVLLATLGLVLTAEQAERMSREELALYLYNKDLELENEGNTTKNALNREKKPLNKELKKKESTPSVKVSGSKKKEPATQKAKIASKNNAIVVKKSKTDPKRIEPIIAQAAIPVKKNGTDAVKSKTSINKSSDASLKKPAMKQADDESKSKTKSKPKSDSEIKTQAASKLTKRELNKQLFIQELEMKKSGAKLDSNTVKPSRKVSAGKVDAPSINKMQKDEPFLNADNADNANNAKPSVAAKTRTKEITKPVKTVKDKSKISISPIHSMETPPSDSEHADSPVDSLPIVKIRKNRTKKEIPLTESSDVTTIIPEMKPFKMKSIMLGAPELNETENTAIPPEKSIALETGIEGMDKNETTENLQEIIPAKRKYRKTQKNIPDAALEIISGEEKTPTTKRTEEAIPLNNQENDLSSTSSNDANDGLKGDDALNPPPSSASHKTHKTTIRKTARNIPETPATMSEPTSVESSSAAQTESGIQEKQPSEGQTEKHHRHTRKTVDTETNADQADNRQNEELDGKRHEKNPTPETMETVEGALEIMPDGYGFLRKVNYLQSPKDIYIPPQYIRRFGLRPGDWISGPGKVQRETDRYQAILYIKEVNGLPPEKMLGRPHFDQLTPIYPDERFILETSRNELSTRIIDLVAPIGKGQRGMIVSPPKAGKTILLQKIANAIATNNPEAKLIVLLIDERPEEVTDMQRSINGEVVYSTFDKTPENHVKVVELVLERAMRLVELGQDVVILLDSITRLARAYNLTINPTGRTLSGGLDPGALYGPKRFFGSARNIENGGSLTIIATSLIDTGSRMDEVIFEEFKGTGNMEVYLDRKLSEKRIFPAIDLNRSGTRREELLLSKRELDAVWTIRKAFGQLDTSAVTEMIINLLLKTNHNSHFVSSVNVSLNDKAMFDAMRGTKPGGNGNSNNNGSGGNNSGYGNNNNYGN